MIFWASRHSGQRRIFGCYWTQNRNKTDIAALRPRPSSAKMNNTMCFMCKFKDLMGWGEKSCTSLSITLSIVPSESYVPAFVRLPLPWRRQLSKTLLNSYGCNLVIFSSSASTSGYIVVKIFASQSEELQISKVMLYTNILDDYLAFAIFCLLRWVMQEIQLS